jgi:hypothetical protein
VFSTPATTEIVLDTTTGGVGGILPAGVTQSAAAKVKRPSKFVMLDIAIFLQFAGELNHGFPVYLRLPPLFWAANPLKSAMLEYQTRLGDSVARLLPKGFRGFWNFLGAPGDARSGRTRYTPPCKRKGARLPIAS